MPSWFSLSFQDSSSFSMWELSSLHDYVMTIMCGVIFLIIYVMFYLLFTSKYYKHLSEGTFIETIWSMVPAFLLVLLVLPSMKVLYLMEDIKIPSLTFKVVGHQWYWSYILPLFKNFCFKLGDMFFSGVEYDSLPEEVDDSSYFPRLLGSSSDLVVPINTTSRILVSSTDVIHSFAIPALGLKVDALPGRINQLFLNPSRVGVFYGQCSEICGSNHSFMPISLKVGSSSSYDYFSKGVVLDLIKEEVNYTLLL